MSSTEAIESRGSRATNNDEELTAVAAPLAHAMLLPLNKDTLLNGKVLADLWAAMRLNFPLVLLHLQEEEYDAVPFSSFFAQCPPHLKVSRSECPTRSFTSRFHLIQNSGLFDELACTWYFASPYKEVAVSELRRDTYISPYSF
jgi:hypothetical protein